MAREAISKLKYSEAIGQIEKGQIAPFYFITGEEEFLKLEFNSALRKALFKSGSADVNIERMTAASEYFNLEIASLAIRIYYQQNNSKSIFN